VTLAGLLLQAGVDLVVLATAIPPGSR
jgi:hypothetical protein